MFVWESTVVLSAGFILMRWIGKKSVGEMTGLEIITLLAMASMIGHAVADEGLWRTVAILCIFSVLLITVQYLSLKFDWMERWLMGKATPVVQNGEIMEAGLKKLRLTVDQLEAKLREKGIESFRDLKTATVELNGQIGYEYMKHAKPVTIGELERFFSERFPAHWPHASPKPQDQAQNLFQEVNLEEHAHPVSPKLN
ncbi:DUF421 domain-containing protein [Cohnella caldifontis]|uniref:DUF421 domain-containing protein n=1 Tax=Cohnella caldifontis TaxID=3027471 RepID=UPI0023EAEE2A|nr:YetF domain-containing protein [Cohnella sp. YIM B05605]